MNKENIEYCPVCGGESGWWDKELGTWVDIVKHKTCIRISKFEKLSIFDKKSKENTFENAKTLNELEEKYINEFKNYCKNFNIAKQRGAGIFMTGNPGTGKTFLSNCIVNELKKSGYTALCFNLSKYFAEIKQGWEEKERKILKAVEEVDIIVIDDIGNEKIDTDWIKERLFNLFNAVYMNKKPLICSSNLTGEALRNHFMISGSDKVVDRIRELCKGYVFNWKSRRPQIGKEKFEGIF